MSRTLLTHRVTANGVTETNYTGSRTFPSTGNPLYGVPPLGWPAWADNNVYNSFTCDNTTLVFQVPIFDNDQVFCSNVASPAPDFGFPVAITGTGGKQDVATFIYKVVADPAHPASANGPQEYILQYLMLPGWDPASGAVIPGPASAQRGPTTLVTNIIGPLNPNTQTPRVFQYIDRTDGENASISGTVNTFLRGTPEDVPTSNGYGANFKPNGDWVSLYSGVLVNLEVWSGTYSNTASQRKALALKTEVFLRNNSETTVH